MRNNRLGKLIRRRAPADVAGADFAFLESLEHRALDLIGGDAFVDVTQH